MQALESKFEENSVVSEQWGDWLSHWKTKPFVSSVFSQYWWLLKGKTGQTECRNDSIFHGSEISTIVCAGQGFIKQKLKAE